MFAALGVTWAAVWYFYYRDTPEEHAGVNQAERDLIGSGRKRSTEIPWRRILSHSNLWILAVMYFCYNFNLNVYNDWFPTYLHDSRGMTLAKMGIYASLPLFAGTLGDIAGGSFSDMVLKRTGNVNLARRWVAIAGFVLSAAATIPAIFAHDPKVSVAFYCAAFFGLEWTVGVSWAVPLDIGGDFAGSVSAVMNSLGNVGRSAFAIRRNVCGYALRLEFAVPADQRALCDRGAPLPENRREQADCMNGAWMRINPDKCVACGNCTYVCPMGAIYIDPVIQRATVNRERVRGMLCLLQRIEPGAPESDVCPHGAEVVPDGAGAVRSGAGCLPDGGVRAGKTGMAEGGPARVFRSARAA